MTITVSTAGHTVVEHPSGYCQVRTADGTIAAVFFPDFDCGEPVVRYLDPFAEAPTCTYRRGTARRHADRWARMLDGFQADTDGF